MVVDSMCTSKWSLVQVKDEIYPKQTFNWSHKGKNEEERREEKEVPGLLVFLQY